MAEYLSVRVESSEIFWQLLDGNHHLLTIKTAFTGERAILQVSALNPERYAQADKSSKKKKLGNQTMYETQHNEEQVRNDHQRHDKDPLQQLRVEPTWKSSSRHSAMLAIPDNNLDRIPDR